MYLNGQARGCVPADHELFFSRTRSMALRSRRRGAGIGVPMDFRLGFGGAFTRRPQIVVVDVAPPERAHPRPVAVECYGALPPRSPACANAARGRRPPRAQRWADRAARAGDVLREAERAEMQDDRAPLHPLRLYGELRAALARDAIVIGDGGDFVSFAGRVVDSFTPGCWLDPGPFGCLGTGPGYALAAKLARPQQQVVLLLGDGALGFSAMEFDTLVRHGANVVAVVGNNGIWGLEKHPMELLYGYSVAAELRPETRYDEVVRALGGHGELVRAARPREDRPRVNVLTRPVGAFRAARGNRRARCRKQKPPIGRPSSWPSGRAGVRTKKAGVVWSSGRCRQTANNA